ncbi:MAG TPA: VOC family protein [Dehalococcoidia bacterium]|nr:VOC family protein [Dehalococcoidia bacterium]
MPNPVVHFEIVGKDGKKLQDFYSRVFDWQINANNPMQYGIVDNGGQGINGGIAATDQPNGHATFYIEVSDTDQYLRKIESLGGKTVVPTTVIPDMVTFAMFTDPEGNLVGLVKAE